jgi:hypothetical protein
MRGDSVPISSLIYTMEVIPSLDWPPSSFNHVLIPQDGVAECSVLWRDARAELSVSAQIDPVRGVSLAGIGVMFDWFAGQHPAMQTLLCG